MAEVEKGMTMQRKRAMGRLGAMLLASGLLLVLTGDRAQVAAVTRGIDPLDILDLQVKPNIFIVLDSSGSMDETSFINATSGDHPFSKLFQAKQVINDVINDNQSRAQFLFGQYKQPAASNIMANTGTVVNTTPGRFLYHTQSWAAVGALPVQGPSPSMATTPLTVNNLYAFQIIQNTAGVVVNNGIHFTETGGANCNAVVATGFYQTGAALATAIQTAMNACAGKVNTYSVTYNATPRFVFTRTAGAANFQIRWDDAVNSTIRGVLAAGTTATALNAGPFTTANDPRINLLQRVNGDKFTETYDPDGTAGASPSRAVTTYKMMAQRFWNGETVQVSGGTVCGVTLATAATKTNPPSFKLQNMTACGGAVSGAPVIFTWSGGFFGGNACDNNNAFQPDVPLRPCDQTAAVPLQLTKVAPFLRREFLLNADGSLTGYAETTDGTAVVPAATRPNAGGITANGSTPIASTIDGLKIVFNLLWTNPNPGANPTLFDNTFPNKVDAISTHLDPKERTIVLFVTDGDQNCTPFVLGNGAVGAPYVPATMIQSDAAALGAAAAAQKLYAPIVGTVNADGTINGDPYSSVQTYLVGYGQAQNVTRLNAIAWGGSGMTAPPVGLFGGKQTWTRFPTVAERAACKTCTDAFIAPDAATLKTILDAVINQGASSGEFTAQQSVSSNVYELVAQVPGNNPIGFTFDARAPRARYDAVVPQLFSTSFKLPSFDGQLKAFQNVAGTVVTEWNAGQLLVDRVTTGMTSCSDGLAGQCLFGTLSSKIDRRVYTTSGNGVFPATVANLTDPNWIKTNGGRENLWPPPVTVAPASNTSAGKFDFPLGLPLSATATDYSALQTQFGTCLGVIGAVPVAVEAAGSGHPCSTSNGIATRTQRARREAREMILAYMAGAQVARDAQANPKRIATGGSAGEILYVARPWVLKDSTHATPAVVGPPIQEGPTTNFATEYLLFRDGFRDGTNVATDGTLEGFGLRNPDDDAVAPTVPPNGVDSRANLKPAMTTLYLGANDMLHAFRASQSNPDSTGACTRSATTDCGGEEMWGFVPYDQLGKLAKHLATPSRTNHVYMIASALRFADVFVPNPGTASDPSGTTITKTVGSASAVIAGVWRRVLLVGRGIGGKYFTALDVTTPGPYTSLALTSLPPVVLWNRGNPDTADGTIGGVKNNTTPDYNAYLKMGETWSVPTVAFVDPAEHVTTRKASGVKLAVHVGSGYGDRSGCAAGATPCEGTTYYTLDALTGDVVASADVGARTTRPTGAYDNALVASPADYNFDPAQNKGEFTPSQQPHPAEFVVRRSYIGDLDGRVWKFLSSSPSTPVLFQDLGKDQPIAVPAALQALSGSVNTTARFPHIYVETGNESRADPTISGQFGIFGMVDEQADNDPTSPAPPTFPGGVNGCVPGSVDLPCLFATLFEPGSGFRGTVQPATTFQDKQGTIGRAFFVATRFNPPPPAPNAAPVPPYPCRSTFDSIFYAVGAQSGQAAFDLNGAGQDSFAILTNSKIQALSFVPDTRSTGGGLGLVLDEGLRGGQPPVAGELPPGGNAPTGVSGGNGVVMSAISVASTVCQ